MPQRVVCQDCGKRLKASDNAAGKRVRCKCGAAVPVPPLTSASSLARPAPAPAPASMSTASDHPAAATGDDLLAGLEGLAEGATAGTTCPQCRGFLPSGAVLCTSCGLNLQSGQRLATAVQVSAAPVRKAAEPAPKAVRGKVLGDQRDRTPANWGLFGKAIVAAAIVAGIVYCYYEFSSYDPKAQGNAMLAQLKPGMTPKQVVDICGKPREVFRLATGRGLDAQYALGEPVKAEYSDDFTTAYKDRIALGFFFVYRFTPAGDHHVLFDGSGAMLGHIEIPNIFRE